LGCDKDTNDDLTQYMLNNKTECALKLFDSPEDIVIPIYIRNAISER
jgi:putative ATP-dependent endonuclease of OLD family